MNDNGARTTYALEVLDIGFNQFEGPFPAHLLKYSPNMTTFVSPNTCFNGSLSSDVCNARKLQTLVIPGLTAACELPLWKWSPIMEKQFPAFTVNYMDGTLPQCVIQLPEMRALIASGNGFRGSIPLNTSRKLVVVDLSSNQFEGEIPKALLSVRSLRKLDLSFNNINGGVEVFNQLNSSADIVANMSIKVKLNRLSGQVPSLLCLLYTSDAADE